MVCRNRIRSLNLVPEDVRKISFYLCHKSKHFIVNVSTTGGGKRQMDELRTTDEKLDILDSIHASSLLDLNDDCLYPIFDSKHLPIMDLVAITQSCTRFKTIGNQIFARKHKICSFQNLSVKVMAEAIRVLQTFGSLILELTINLSSYSYPTGVMDAVSTYCTSLESLSLHSYNLPENQVNITEMGSLFRKLNKLHIYDVCIENVESWELLDGIVTPQGCLIDVFTNCNSLIDLKVVECYSFEHVVFSSTFPNPKLQHFQYFDMLDERPNVGCFILRHKNLKSFDLESDDSIYNYIPVLKTIVICEFLESLRLGLRSSLVEKDTSLRSMEII